MHSNPLIDARWCSTTPASALQAPPIGLILDASGHWLSQAPPATTTSHRTERICSASLTVTVEGPSLSVGIGTLPLAEGYRAQFAGFDSQSLKPTTYTIEVTGTETAEVPAGTYETWVVQLTQGDGSGGGSGTLWVSQDRPGVVVKSEIGLGPQMGGGTATAVLTSVE